ncbi:hypothetical protein [Herbaspirillum sp. B65]|jgi:hypothetical protein|uniref:hypothetical protein n=1 Tax=Herbaspirillum sp. B65 TaxID=137708 RepID=UPI0011D260E2|nr:hypothetical protein [Herbaspirillum sp. B65]
MSAYFVNNDVIDRLRAQSWVTIAVITVPLITVCLSRSSGQFTGPQGVPWPIPARARTIGAIKEKEKRCAR